jgi:hypothetical protein
MILFHFFTPSPLFFYYFAGRMRVGKIAAETPLDICLLNR